MLPHIEEMSKLTIVYYQYCIKQLLNITSMQTRGAEVQGRMNTTCPKASAASGGYMTAFMATLEGLINEERVTKSECGPSIVELISSLRECYIYIPVNSIP